MTRRESDPAAGLGLGILIALFNIALIALGFIAFAIWATP